MNGPLNYMLVQTAPRAGAVIPLTFETVSGRAVLIRATQADGKVVPFGAEVVDDNGQSVGAMGQGSQLFVRGAEEGGVLMARWGDAVDEQCHIQYSLPARTKGSEVPTITTTDAVCR